MQSQIASLESHAQTQVAQREKLRSALSHTQRQIDSKLEKQREYAAKMDGQARLNGPELGFWETYLGCRIEGSGDESRVKVVFVFPPSKAGGNLKEEREAVFELKVPESGSGRYEVVYTRPRLRGEDVEGVVGRLNETREIGSVLKGMRGLFVEEMK
jgi:Chromosome segregation protein Spc25